MPDGENQEDGNPNDGTGRSLLEEHVRGSVRHKATKSRDPREIAKHLLPDGESDNKHKQQ